jgi:L-threonylcarbamoyladenylate synthase
MTEDIFDNDIEPCLKLLHAGGVILYPTDTVWGLGCDATNEAAVKKIIDIKHRADSKSFVVLAASEKDILQYTASPDLSVFDYLQQTEKPTTVIYDHAIGLAENVIAADGSVAIRICNDAFCKTLIKRFRKPIVSTSANISGEPTPAVFNEINNAIKNAVDYVVGYKQNITEPATASSIIRWRNGQAEIIRK